jgi:colanic acid biosynthesis glycosyl transferase WcaI
MEKSSKKRDRLWVITELYYPEETSTGYYLTRIAEGLADDFDVKALCGQPNYSGRGIRAPKHEFHNDVEIFRAAGTTLDKNVVPFRITNMLTLGVSIFAKAIRNFKKGDRVLVVTTPPSMPFIAAIASLVRGGSYTLLIHDNYPEILIAVGKIKPDSKLSGIVNFCNRWLYKYAAMIIVVGRDMRELVERKTAGLDIPIATIPNWAELESVSPDPKTQNALLQELGLSEKFVFLYAGNMGHPNDLESIVTSAEKLLVMPEIHFIFLGTGVKRPWLETEIAARDLKNITILDPKPRSEQQAFLNACDVAIVSLVARMTGVSMPSRTYNALAAGKPILALAEPGSELAQVIDDDMVGWVVSPGKPDELLELILEIYEKRDQLAEMGARAANAAHARYSLETALNKYKAALRLKHIK